MATCNVNTLLSNGAAFQSLSDEGLRCAIIACLKQIVVKNSPGTDVTPSGVLARGAAFQTLDDAGVRNCIFRSACVLGGG
jgi:hypothetical protein